MPANLSLCGFLSTLATMLLFSTRSLSLNQGEEIGKNMTDILNKILENYDSRSRPYPVLNNATSTERTEVLIDINIRSMGPISETERSYSMDCYFRHTWKDERLKFTALSKEMAVHATLLDKLWKPDTYFFNGKKSYLHTITTSNKLLRIKYDGTIFYSMRLTIKADCPMRLQSFPMDRQRCPLIILSNAHSSKNVIYRWKYGNQMSIKMADDLALSQFDVTASPHNNFTKNINNISFSALKIEFEFKRHMGYFLIQVYVPTSLLVVLSWVSFWINREATADRIGLGITTVLTTTTMCADTKNEMPQVSYATALDVYMLMCFIFVIFTLVQFVGVHYFTKTGDGDVQPESDDEDELPPPDPNGRKKEREKQKKLKKSALAKGIMMLATDMKYEEANESCCRSLLHCLGGSQTYRVHRRKKALKLGGANSVSRIDIVSRVLFPATFGFLNVLYWMTYYYE